MAPRTDIRRLTHALAIGLFLVAVSRTAWLSDDAYITLRTVDNLASGYGLRWNVAERVQTYTHPLWMLLLALPYWLTREPYFTPLAVSIICSTAAVWILLTRIAASAWTALLAGTVVVFSKAFVDYSTSGLENPLTHLLLAVFVLLLIRDRGLMPLWLIASLLMVNRLDAGLLVLPALLVRTANQGCRAAARAVPLGLAPLLVWELFSLVYYGFPFPNTGYAKLGIGAGAGTLMAQGGLYLLDSATNDPVTLLALAGMTVAALTARPRQSWPLALGVGLYLAYVVRIGGDFMSGRFLTAPLLVAMANFARIDWVLPRAVMASASLVPVATFAVLGLLTTTRPPLRSGANTFILTPAEGLGIGGVADERAFYYRYTGLLRWTRAQPLPFNAEVQWGREAAAAQQPVVVHHNVGLFGFFAGPAVHVIDPYALGDPLLARLPPIPGWRIGHFEREIPEGYPESVRTGRNVIADTAVAMKYEQLKLITQGPLWSRRRWRAMLTLNRP